MIPLLRVGLTGLILWSVPSLNAAPATKVAVPTADETLALIPPKAIAVVQVHGIERVQDRLARLLQTAVPDKAETASKAVRDGIAQTLRGRDLSTLRGDGRLIVAISDLEKVPDDATVTFLFPANDVDAFRQGFLTKEERNSLKKDGDLETLKWEDRDEPFYLVPVKGYVAISSDKQMAQKYRAGDTAGAGSPIPPDLARTFLDVDVGVFFNVREVRARYGEKLEQYRGLAELFLKGGTVQGVSREHAEQIRITIDAAFQVVRDGTGVVLGLELRPDGVTLRGLAGFGAKTEANLALQKHKATPLAQLGTLPAGQMFYTASTFPAGIRGWGASPLGSLTADDEDPTARETIEAVLRELGQVDSGVNLAAGTMLGRAIEITESKDAGKIVDARLRLLKALTRTATYSGFPLTEKPAIREKAETVGGFTFHAARMKFDLDKAVADEPEEKKEPGKSAARRILGGDETTIWLGTDGRTFLQVTARDWKHAKALIDAYQDRAMALETVDAFQFTRKRLPPEVTTLVLWDTGQALTGLVSMFNDAGGGPGFPLQVPDLKGPDGKPSYLGIALVLKPGHGSFELFLPAKAVGQVRKILEPLLDKGN